VAEPAKIGKDLAQVHAPSQAACWLLTHRFKPTKIAILGVESALLGAKEMISDFSHYKFAIAIWNVLRDEVR
jgi:hypothetical protein